MAGQSGQWVAIAQRNEDAWDAVVGLETKERMVPHRTCDHHHKSKAAAQKCAKELAEQEGVLTL